jgi:hypothetical protein
MDKMPKQSKIRLGWAISVLAMAALACTCGALGQVQQGVQTAEALATQGQQVASQAAGLATQVEQSGVLKTAQAEITQLATGGVAETAQAVETQVDQPGVLATAQALAGQAGGAATGIPADVPIYPKNVNMTVFGNVFAYNAEADLVTVTTFYKTELENQGWKQSRDPILSDAANLFEYKKDTRTLQLTLTAAGTATTVGIRVMP